MQYFFILGRNPLLSKAEIEAVLGSKAIKSKVVKSFDNILILQVEKELDIQWLNNRMGGTVKIGQIIDGITTLEKFEERFFDLIKVEQGKLHFGFSLYPLSDKINIKKYQQKLKPVAMEIKRILREAKNLNSRWVVSRDLQLSSVIVKKNQLLKYGSEICFFISGDEILIGQTLAVQPFAEFGARDFKRPARDDISGMLPPKLARIMINLAQVKEQAVIMDPFCGSGTVLQEALLMGYANIIGSDNSDKAVKDSIDNLKWLEQKYELTNMKYKVLKLDVKDLSKKFAKNSIEAIITEPYLGPAIKGNESIWQIKDIIDDLEQLYRAALVQFQQALKKKGKLIIVVPYYKKFNLSLDLNKHIDKIGFKRVLQEPLFYYREKQHVWRQIVVLEKNNY